MISPATGIPPCTLRSLSMRGARAVEHSGNSLQNLDRMEALFNKLWDFSEKINTRVLEQTVEELKTIEAAQQGDL